MSAGLTVSLMLTETEGFAQIHTIAEKRTCLHLTEHAALIVPLVRSFFLFILSGSEMYFFMTFI